MQRRSFVRTSVLGAAVSGLGACHPERRRRMDGQDLPEGDLASRLSELDEKMHLIACSPISVGKFAHAANASPLCKEDPLDEQLVRSSLRALLLTGSVKDLPANVQERPEVTARLALASPEIDFAVFGMNHRLAGMSAEELDDVQDALRADPNLASRVAELLSDEAQAVGIPLRRRLHFRRLVNHVVWRLGHQPVSLLLDEYTHKVQRHTANLERKVPRDLRSDDLLARENVEHWEAQTLQIVERYASTPSSCGPAASVSGPELEVKRERARLLLRNGGIVLGVGIGLAALGVGLTFAAVPVGLFILTAAGIMLIAGIITMIVAGVRRSRLAS